jgi:hypothetical protein
MEGRNKVGVVPQPLMKVGICTKSTQMGAFALPGESHGVASLIMPFWVCQHLILLF